VGGVWRAYDRILETVVVLMMAAIVVIMGAQVVARYVFGHPFVWAEEISTYLFVWIVFLGSGLAFQRRAHIALDYFVRRLPSSVFAKLHLLLSLVVLAFLGLLAYQGLNFIGANRGVPAYTTTWVGLDTAYAAGTVGALVMIVGLLRAIRPQE
jgi:TRAP-type C4-dicarboxylate transport system permease small subunit